MVAPVSVVHAAGINTSAHTDSDRGNGATARAKEFAERLERTLSRTPVDIDLRTLCAVIGAYTPGACAPLERGVCDAALRESSTSAESAAKAAVRYITERVTQAGEEASACAAAYLRTNRTTCVALFAGSQLAAAACSQAEVTEVRAIGFGEAPSQAIVRRAPLEGAGEMLKGAEALVIGAVEVAHNGAILVAPGCGALCYMASRFSVPVLVVAQAAKFTDRVLCASVHEGFDVLKPHEIEVLCTELGQFKPSQAPDVYKKINVEN